MKNKKVIRKPSETYKFCPACQSKNLIRLEVDVLCGDCDWMSCEEYVQSGGMDNFFTAFQDHFPVGPEVELTQPHEETTDPIGNDDLFEADASA